MAKKDKLLVGVDIGTHAVKVCQLQKTGSQYTLEAIGSALLPPGAVEDGVLQEPDEVSKVIATLFKNLKFKRNTQVGISISGYSVIVKKVNLDVMEKDELDEYIKAEAEQYIPFDLDDVYLAYQDLNTAQDEFDRTDVMLVAAKKEVVDSYLDMLRSIKLNPLLVDVDGFALENIWNTIEPEDKDIALIDIGAAKMNINIISEGASILARDIGVGSQQLTEQISRELSIEEDDAEKLKLGVTPAADKQKELEEIVTSICTNWIFEIKKAIDLYTSKKPERPLSKIVLSGGGSKVKGLVEFIHKETGIKVLRFNPFDGMKINEKKIDRQYLNTVAPEMTIAAGLAIRPSEI